MSELSAAWHMGSDGSATITGKNYSQIRIFRPRKPISARKDGLNRNILAHVDFSLFSVPPSPSFIDDFEYV